MQTSVRLTFPISEELIAEERKLAMALPRKRSMYMIVGGPHQPKQAMLNTFTHGSYAQPHKHAVDEYFECIDGEFKIIIFNGNSSGILEARILKPGESILVSAGAYHTAVLMGDYGTIYEAKNCYYNPDTDKEFATWCGKEGDPTNAAYLEHLRLYA